MSNTEAEFDKLASELYKTLGIDSGERLKSAARSGSWRRREEHSSSMKVKQDWATESRRRVSSEVASPPSVSSPPNDLAAYTFTKPNISPKKTVGRLNIYGNVIPVRKCLTRMYDKQMFYFNRQLWVV